MRTVYHPTLDVSLEVSDDRAHEWRESGWRFTKPRTNKSPAAATAADQGQHSDEGNEA